MKKRIVTAGLVAGLLAGAGAGLILENSGFAGASNVAAVTATTTPGASSDPAAPAAPAAPADEARPDPSVRLAEVLKPLVDDGTLTQAQADKVVETLAANMPQGGGREGRGGGHGGGQGRQERRAMALDAAATALGTTADDLRTQLESGSTLAQIATAKGVDVQTVVDALVAEANAKLAQAVTDGKITQAQADTRSEKLTERITDMVNNGRPQHGDQPPADLPPAPAG